MSKQRYGDNNTDLEALTGLTPKSLTGYTRLYPAIMLHEIAEQTLDNTNGKLRDCCFTIPRVGKVVIHRSDIDSLEYEFMPDPEFEKQIVKSMNTGSSPLTKILETSVISMINQKYQDLL